MKLPAQGLGRGCAALGLTNRIPATVPLAIGARYGKLEAIAATEIPTEYLVYGAAAGVGAGLLWKAGQWIAGAFGPVDFRDLDLLDAEPWPAPPQRQLAPKPR